MKNTWRVLFVVIIVSFSDSQKVDKLIDDLPIFLNPLTEMQPIGNVPATPTLLA